MLPSACRSNDCSTSRSASSRGVSSLAASRSSTYASALAYTPPFSSASASW